MRFTIPFIGGIVCDVRTSVTILKVIIRSPILDMEVKTQRTEENVDNVETRLTFPRKNIAK